MGTLASSRDDGDARLARAVPDAIGRVQAGPVRATWDATVERHTGDGVTALLDGALTGDSPSLADIVGAWRTRGLGAIARLRGAFTILIWDDAGRGLIASDHLSVRACYLHGEGARTLSFATNLAALRRLMATSPGADADVLLSWVAPRHETSRRTFMRGVERLGGAQALEFGPDWRRRATYWRPQYREVLDGTREELVERLKSGLDHAVDRRLESAAPTGIILSGGVDSSVVAASAARVRGARVVRSYSAVFPEWPAADERVRISATNERLALAGRPFAIAPQGGLRTALEHIRAVGVPPPGPGDLIERPLLGAAREDGVQLVLDGQGGDELFAEPAYLVADRIRRFDFPGVMRLLRHAPGARRRPSKAHLRFLTVDRGLRPALPQLGRVLKPTMTSRPLAADLLSDEQTAILADRGAGEAWRQSGVPLWWAAMAHLLTTSRDESGLAQYTWDRGVRTGIRPAGVLFDVDLIELVLRTPPEANWQRLNRPLARLTAAAELPPSVWAHRYKANIGPFYLSVVGGADRAAWQPLLDDPAARVRQWLNGAALDRWIARDPTRSDADWLVWCSVIWKILMAECWLRWLEDATFIDELLANPRLPHASATPA